MLGGARDCVYDGIITNASHLNSSNCVSLPRLVRQPFSKMSRKYGWCLLSPNTLNVSAHDHQQKGIKGMIEPDTSLFRISHLCENPEKPLKILL